MSIYDTRLYDDEEAELERVSRLPGGFEYVHRIRRVFLGEDEARYMCYDEDNLFLFEVPWGTVARLTKIAEWNKMHDGWARTYC